MILIKKIEKNDILAVVEVHKNSFKDFFLTQVGDNFLYLYYDCVRKANDAVLLGFYDNSILTGFCAAAINSKGFTTRLISQNLISFAILGIKMVFSNPKALLRLLQNLHKGDSDIIEESSYAELYSIGVAENMQGRGIGKQLLNTLEAELRKKKCDKLSLTTDFFENEKVISFYKGLGFKVYYEFVAYPNRKMYRMIKDIN
jgi:ribosomal protein S18 acetylase RimI-like enzyme